MKKRRPKNRPVKARVPREKQAAAIAERDSLYARLSAAERVLASLVEAVGQDNVRRANARLGSARALTALAGHVANGKLREAQVVSSPGTCAVEITESTKDGAVLTESLVAELAAIDPAHAAVFAGKRVGEIFALGEFKAQVRRVWDVVPPAVTP